MSLLAALLLSSVALAQDPISLDAQPETGHLMPGFSALTPLGSTDARVRWRTPPARWTRHDDMDALASDAIAPGGVLEIELQPGSYVAYVLMDEHRWTFRPPAGKQISLIIDEEAHPFLDIPVGNAFFRSEHYARNPFPDFSTQTNSWARQAGRRASWRPVAFEARGPVTTLGWSGAALHGLWIATKAESASAEVELALVDSRREQDYLKHVDPLIYEPIPPLSQEGPLGLELGDLDLIPDPERAAPGLSIQRRAARGERISMMIAVHGGDGGASVEVDPRATFLELHEAHWLDHRVVNVLRPRPTVLRPLDSELRGGQGYPPVLLLTAAVPEDASDDLRTSLQITRGGETATVEIEIQLRSLHLEPLRAHVGAFMDMRAPLTYAHGHESEQAWSGFEQDIGLLRARGFNTIALRLTGPLEPGLHGSWLKPEPPETWLSAVDRWRASGGGRALWVEPLFQIMRPLYADPEGSLVPDKQDPGPLFDTLIRAATEREGVCLYLYDENAMKSDARLRDRAAGFIDLLRSQTDQDLCLAGALPHPYEIPLSEHLDVAMWSYTPRISRQTGSTFRQSGAESFMYLMPEDRAGVGLIPWAMGAEGFLQWHLSETHGDPFDQITPRPSFHQTILAPDGESIWPLVGLETLGEGLVDWRYLQTLQDLVDELEPRRRPRIRRKVQAAKELLAMARQGLDGRFPHLREHGLITDESLRLLRAEAGDLAEDLARFSRRQRRLQRQRP